jgi:hypothetical protein
MLISPSDERWDEIAALQDSRLIAATASDDWSDCLDALQADEPSPSVAP